MIIENFTPFNGQHCETTATGSLLNQIGIELSEPMLFGLGEGLSYIFWNMKGMNLPFLGGRIKPDVLTENICRNLNLELVPNETTSVKKAWVNLERNISEGKAVGLKLDCYHLDYFTRKFHFAAHYVACYGFDNTYAYLVDTMQQGKLVKTSLENLALARNEKGPMSSRNRSYTINTKSKPAELKVAVINAIKANAETYLNPPISNITFMGIYKTSKEIIKWFNTSDNRKNDFQTLSVMMEKAGTGGSLFRNLYRDFIGESAVLLNNELLFEVHSSFKHIAQLWHNVAMLFNQSGETEEIAYIHDASEKLIELSELEKASFEKLQKLS